MTPPNELLDALCRAIASGDEAATLRMLRASRGLASQAVVKGATRDESTAYFLNEIAHYIYAGDTALHITAAAYRVQIAPCALAVPPLCVRFCRMAPTLIAKTAEARLRCSLPCKILGAAEAAAPKQNNSKQKLFACS